MRPQFSLATLLLCVTVLAVVCAFVVKLSLSDIDLLLLMVVNALPFLFPIAVTIYCVRSKKRPRWQFVMVCIAVEVMAFVASSWAMDLYERVYGTH